MSGASVARGMGGGGAEGTMRDDTDKRILDTDDTLNDFAVYDDGR